MERLIAGWAFDEGDGKTTLEEVSGTSTPIHSNFNAPEWRGGISGHALRFDGFSTWMEHSLSPDPRPAGELSISVWVAVPAYPVSDAALVNQYTPERTGGFSFGLDRYGQLFLSAAIAGEWRTCRSGRPVPKDRWVHLAGAFRRESGLEIFMDGQLLASVQTPEGEITPVPRAPLVIGRDAHSPVHARIFPTGVLNGLVDELRIHSPALPATELRRVPGPRHARPDLSVPPSRFAGDPQRPRYHSLPEANWTNEPHGLVGHDRGYHLFFQKNPNGPYWSQIHWGHLKSRDLTSWKEEAIALAPEPGYDQAGIWSGSCVVHRGIPTAVYTGVDGEKAGVCLATSRDGMRTWLKNPKNPVIGSPPNGYLDFRDPYAWREGDTWYLIIGSGIPDVGGTALLYRSNDLEEWAYLKPVHQDTMDRSGFFWEMPVLIPIGDGKHLLYVTTMEHGKPARGLYWLGVWKDETFTPDSPDPLQLDLINWMLSPAMAPAPEGGVVAIGIVPEMRIPEEQLKAGWAHTFSLPRLLSLSPDGSLVQRPHPALQKLRGRRHFAVARTMRPSHLNLTEFSGEQLEIRAEILPSGARRFGLRLRCAPDAEEETLLYYDVDARRICVDRSRSSLNAHVDRANLSGPFDLPPHEPLSLHVFLDRSVVEVFVNGRGAFATRIYPVREDSRGIGLYAEGGETLLQSMEVYILGPVDREGIRT